MQYRRNFQPGGSYFFTVVMANRRPILRGETEIARLRHAFRSVCARYPFDIDAIVVLPDHLHCIWTLPGEDFEFARRWRLIKSAFTRGLNASSRAGSVWQKRYWEHTIRNEKDFLRHVEYIHYNPVRHGYVDSPIDWRYSSFRKYVRTGEYPADWGAGEMNFQGVGKE